MKYVGMPMGMWLLYSKSFRDHLVFVFDYDLKTADEVTAKAKWKYRSIIESLPEFEKEDRFKMNIVNCALVSAFILNMPERPSVEKLTEFYAKAMMNELTKKFFALAGKNKFSAEDLKGMRQTADLDAADRNPYSWNMDLLEFKEGSGYEARFTKCGICTLMNELGLYDLVPAMCSFDYTMAEAAGTYDFVREYTLASGGPYCDCGYKRKSHPRREEKNYV